MFFIVSAYHVGTKQLAGFLAAQAAALSQAALVAHNSPGQVTELVVHGQSAVPVHSHQARADESVQVCLGRVKAAPMR